MALVIRPLNRAIDRYINKGSTTKNIAFCVWDDYTDLGTVVDVPDNFSWEMLLEMVDKRRKELNQEYDPNYL